MNAAMLERVATHTRENIAQYHILSKKTAPPSEPKVEKINDPVSIIPFVASDGIGWVIRIFIGRLTVKIGSKNVPRMKEKRQVMYTFPAGITNTSAMTRTVTLMVIRRSAVRYA